MRGPHWAQGRCRGLRRLWPTLTPVCLHMEPTVPQNVPITPSPLHCLPSSIFLWARVTDFCSQGIKILKQSFEEGSAEPKRVKPW